MELEPIDKPCKPTSRWDRSDLQDWTGNDFTRGYMQKEKPKRDSGVGGLLILILIVGLSMLIFGL